MKKFFTYFICILGIFLAAETKAVIAQKKSESKNNSVQAKNANEKPMVNESLGTTDSFTEFENGILDEINAVRGNPQQYADYLEDIRKYYKDKLFTFPDRTPVLTIEGTTAIDDAVANLRIAKPTNPLKSSGLIHRASNDQMKDFLSGTKLGHKGSDGSMPDERLSRYMSLDSIRMGENVVMSRGGARDIILQMLVDDGIPSRSHRRNLLDPEFQFIGISSGEKVGGESYNVFVFTTGENAEIKTSNSRKNEIKEF